MSWVKMVPEGYETRLEFAYNRDIINAIRDIPGRRYNPKRRCWTIPTHHTTTARHAIETTGHRSFIYRARNTP